MPLPPRRQAVVFICACLLAALWPSLATVPSPYSGHFNPLAAFVGALFVGALTFALASLLSRPLSAVFILVAAVWFAGADEMGAAGAFLLAGLATGVVLHAAVRARVREDLLIVLTMVMLLAGTAGLYALGATLHGQDALARLASAPRHLVQTSLQVVRSVLFPFGPLERADQLRMDDLAAEGESWMWLMPANALVASSFTLFVLTRAIRRHIPGVAERVPPFWAFAVTEWAVWPVVVLCLADAAAIHWDWLPLRAVCDNALWILVNLYLLGGLAVVHCFTLQMRFGLGMRLWTWCIVILFGGNLLAAVGLFDTWFHFRRWGAKLAANRNGG